MSSDAQTQIIKVVVHVFTRRPFSRTNRKVFLVFVFLDKVFFVALEPILELALVDQAGLKLTEICLSLPLECWD